MNSGASSSQRTPAQRAVGNGVQQLPTPPKTPASSSGQRGVQPPVHSQAQQQQQYMSYPGTEPQQPQPAPYQSNGSRRRRTQAELQMVHGITWLGYGAVIPNVSVVTGEALVDGPLHTHGTRVMGGTGNYEDDFNDGRDLAARMSRSLTIGINRHASQGR